MSIIERQADIQRLIAERRAALAKLRTSTDGLERHSLRSYVNILTDNIAMRRDALAEAK